MYSLPVPEKNSVDAAVPGPHVPVLPPPPPPRGRQYFPTEYLYVPSVAYFVNASFAGAAFVTGCQQCRPRPLVWVQEPRLAPLATRIGNTTSFLTLVAGTAVLWTAACSPFLLSLSFS